MAIESLAVVYRLDDVGTRLFLTLAFVWSVLHLQVRDDARILRRTHSDQYLIIARLCNHAAFYAAVYAMLSVSLAM